MSGILGLTRSPRYEITSVKGRGRGIFVCEEVKKGSYVLEYEADVYPRRQRAEREREYVANGEGCFIIDVQTSNGWMCFDATRHFLSPGRLMNHAQRGIATVCPFKPILVNGQWRLGFLATRDLNPGEELTWDYGCAPRGIEWLKKRPKASATSEACGVHGRQCVCVVYNCVLCASGSAMSCTPRTQRPADVFDFILSEAVETRSRNRGACLLEMLEPSLLTISVHGI